MASAALGEVERLGDELLAAAALLPVEDQARALEQQITRLQAAQTDVLTQAEQSADLADSGCRTARSFAMSVLRRSAADASQLSLVGRHLSSLPQLARAYRDGLAHTANMRAIMAHVQQCGLDVLQAHEDALVVLATGAGPHEIYTFCRQLADLNHPDRDADKVRAEGSRSVKIARVGDLAHLDAMVDPAVADQLRSTLAAMARAARTPDDPRTLSERKADALESVLRRGMDTSDLPTQARKRPHANLTVQLETLLSLPGHGRALLERFGLIPRSTAARVACDALVRVIVRHGERVLNVGREQRVVTDRQHAALAALFPTCAFPGCKVRFSDCEIHHLWWWSLAGPTDLDLQVPQCWSHHRLLHEHGFSLSRENGLLVHRDPRGRVIADPDQCLRRVSEQLDLLDRASDDSQPTDSLPVGSGSRYRRGRWGWNGQDPDPPPGHDPPLAPDAA